MSNLLSILFIPILGLLGWGNDEIELLFVGDAMQHKPQIVAATRADGSLDYTQCFTMIEDDIAQADFAVANLEVPLAGKPYSGYPVFSCPDEFATQLKTSGFDLLLTANNHCLDRGSRGARRTIAQLRKTGISSIGSYSSAAARDSIMPFIVEIKNKKIAFLTYTYGTNGMPLSDGIAVDLIDRDLISRDLAEARKAGAHAICVCMHWGVEYSRTPSDEQLSLTDFLIDNGADIIIGSHPHVVQPFEMRFNPRTGYNVPIAYSLGNFISNQNDIDSRGGAMAVVKIKFDKGKVVDTEMEYKLLFCNKPLGRKGENYRVVPAALRDSVSSDQRGEFDRFMQRTRALLQEHNSGDVDENTAPASPTASIWKR